MCGGDNDSSGEWCDGDDSVVFRDISVTILEPNKEEKKKKRKGTKEKKKKKDGKKVESNESRHIVLEAHLEELEPLYRNSGRAGNELQQFRFLLVLEGAYDIPEPRHHLRGCEREDEGEGEGVRG